MHSTKAFLAVSKDMQQSHAIIFYVREIKICAIYTGAQLVATTQSVQNSRGLAQSQRLTHNTCSH